MEIRSQILTLEARAMKVPIHYDDIAPDESDIRLIPNMNGSGLFHCTFPADKKSHAVYHKTNEEIRYFHEGQGKVWRKQKGQKEVIHVGPGISLIIPLGNHFQFRNTESESLRSIIVSIPPRPGEDEAARVKDHW